MYEWLKKVLSSPNLFSIFYQILTRKLCATMALKTLVFVRNWWFYLIFNPCLNSDKKVKLLITKLLFLVYPR